ncbi:MAG: LamB/YcsF family protein [Pseudomonadota bacterium]
MSVDINCDMGESFSLYKMGSDEALMPHITEANVACGFHASDPNHMKATVELAKRHGVKVGAHPSLPDLAGFGRREMKIDRDEMANIIAYQVGALKAFLDMADMPLSHIKPHGALYGMAAREEHIAHAVADVASHYKVPVFGLTGTLHETIYPERGVTFRSEFFADLEYDGSGKLLITREHHHVDPSYAAERSVRAVSDGKIIANDGTELSCSAETVCVHSDTPNAEDIAKAVNAALQPLMAA